MSITITLPLPDSSMSGHAKGHWRAAAGKTKRLRDSAFTQAIVAKANSRCRFPFTAATVAYRFYVPTNARRDSENMRHSCKAYIDGIVDAEIVTDDCWQALRSGPAEVEIDRANPRVEITITGAKQ